MLTGDIGAGYVELPVGRFAAFPSREDGLQTTKKTGRNVAFGDWENRMFSSPPEVTARVFAELPDELRCQERRSDWASAYTGGKRPLHSFLEGPCFDGEGRLYCVDVAYGRIFRFANRHFEVVADYDGEPNGLKVRKDGRIFIADFKKGILELDPATGRVEVVCDRFRSNHFKAVNDLTFAGDGTMYFTDQGTTGLQDPSGCVYRRSPDGRLDLLMGGLLAPNGLVLNREETELFVAATRGNNILRLPLAPDGGVTKAGVFIQMSGGIGPDGMTIDAEGNLIVAHIGLGSVWVFNADGEPIKRVRSCRGKRVTNVAFGGADLKTLVITEADSGSILSVESDIPGFLR